MGRTLARWTYAFGSTTGRSHERADLPCQDFVRAEACGVTVAIALADGAGSAKHSAVGARLSVASTIELLTKNFEDLVADDTSRAQHRILGVIRDRLGDEARRTGSGLDDFATTLLFVAVNGESYVAGHVGDGVICCERNGVLKVLSVPSRGEHANETVFVTSNGAAALLRLERGSLQGVSSFALMSDGSAESLHKRADGTVAPAVRTMCGWLDTYPSRVVSNAISNNLRDVIRRETADDCSLGILHQVVASMDSLAAADEAFQREFLDCRSRRGVGTRLAILKAMDHAAEASVKDLARSSGFSRTTVRKHAKALRLLTCTTSPREDAAPANMNIAK